MNECDMNEAQIDECFFYFQAIVAMSWQMSRCSFGTFRAILTLYYYIYCFCYKLDDFDVGLHVFLTFVLSLSLFIKVSVKKAKI